MTQTTLFAKPVDRPIEGVIKADDEASLRIELEEYVLTNEVEKRLEAFLQAYNSYVGANGVWVSGFFGSGKSHLLKILALLLENREVDGRPTLDYFWPKCAENEFLRGELRRAVAIPSRSILFNIDQKADIISKTEFDALLAVFMKVFDEMCGYYGKLGHIARFERQLDSEGLYSAFKEAYQVVAGKPWAVGREQTLLESTNIAKAYAQVTGNPEASAMGILDRYRQDYRVSIEDFAEEVKTYIDQQAPGFRLNFFVDEVGQYIADHIKLMTNLQTIAESLATRCQGRAWIIVTAQEDMNAVIGEMGRQQSNDFTKIQARFANRMKLTSQDVAEVIQKRLLLKNETGVAVLSGIYQQQANNFKTLFDFADGAQTYRNFKDEEHFVNCYPFIPYQFALFQATIQQLSEHNAFEGKHSSVGERSMLGVFQDVAKHIDQGGLGQLATFDLMFEGIRTTLKSNIQSSILLAEKQLDNAFAIRLLKALFLVKYVREFKATVRNLCVLMLESFDQDLGLLRQRVQEALNLLEQQTYIQRHGELYEYLTDEEKDVEQEIKGTEVETSEVTSELEKLVFDRVIKTRKIRYGDAEQDYPFTPKLDYQLYGRDSELTIHVISPFSENRDNEDLLKLQNMGHDELLVIMPASDLLVRDLLMYKRTEKYVRVNLSTQQEAIKRILNDKQLKNNQRHTELGALVKSLLGQAKLFISGSELDIGGEDAQNRITLGFHELIGRVYPNLRMLRGITYKEDAIAAHLKHSEEGLFAGDVTNLSEAEQEVLAFIQSNLRTGGRTTLKALVERFERKPYGWYYAAILCNLAKLCARAKVEVRTEGNLLEDDDLEQALRNSRQHSNVILDPQIEFTPAQVRHLKDFYADFFHKPPSAGEAKALGQETGAAFKSLQDTLKGYGIQASQYPFLAQLNPIVEMLKELCGKSYTWYLTELVSQEDKLLELKEQVIDPIQQFMNGAQKTIYDDAQRFVQEQRPNFTYIAGDDPDQVEAVLADPTCYRGNKMQLLKTRLDDLNSSITTQIQAEVSQATIKANDLKAKLCNQEEFSKLSEQQQQELIHTFDVFLAELPQQTLIAMIRESLNRFEVTHYQQALSKLMTWTQPAPTVNKPGDPPGGGGLYRSTDIKMPEGRAAEPPPVVLLKSVKVNFEKPWLTDEADVDQYLDAMRQALLEEVRRGKRVQI
jgi:hypothetical protein